jgi:hypothetical protein
MYSIILLESILLTIVLQISIRASLVQQEMWAYLRAWSPSCGQRLLSSRSVGSLLGIVQGATPLSRGQGGN